MQHFNNLIHDIVNNPGADPEVEAALESFNDVHGSTEDLKDFAQDFKTAGTRLKSSMLDSGLLVERRIEKAQKLLAEKKGKESKKNTVTLGSSLNNISNIKATTNYKDLKKVLDGLYELNDTVEDKYFPSAVEAAMDYMRVVKDVNFGDGFVLIDFFKFGTTDKKVGRLRDAFKKLDLDSLLKYCTEEEPIKDKPKKVDEHTEGKVGSVPPSKYLCSPPLVNKYVFNLECDPILLKEQQDPVDEARRQRKVLFGMTEDVNSDWKKLKGGELDVLTLEECEELLDRLLKYTRTYRVIIRNGDYEELRNASVETTRMLYGQLNSHFNLSSKVRSFAWLGSVSENWAVKPYVELAMVITKANKATLDYVEKSLKTYV
jgi:hypothetical protein